MYCDSPIPDHNNNSCGQYIRRENFVAERNTINNTNCRGNVSDVFVHARAVQLERSELQYVLHVLDDHQSRRFVKMPNLPRICGFDIADTNKLYFMRFYRYDVFGRCVQSHVTNRRRPDRGDVLYKQNIGRVRLRVRHHRFRVLLGSVFPYNAYIGKLKRKINKQMYFRSALCFRYIGR